MWEIFFVKKYIDSKYWRIKSVWYILTSRQYFDNSSIFWLVCGLLSKFRSKIQFSGEHLAKTRATATAASGSNIFNTMNFDQNFDGTCVGNMASKILSKIGRPFFASKYWLLFWSCMGPLSLVIPCRKFSASMHRDCFLAQPHDVTVVWVLPWWCEVVFVLSSRQWLPFNEFLSFLDVGSLICLIVMVAKSTKVVVCLLN